MKLTGGGGTFYALESDGTVWAWGGNGFGQLGNGTTNPGQTNTATQVQGLTAITAIAAGDSHALALRSDGTVWAWGNDYNGQLGDGNGGNQQNILVYSTTPVQVVDSPGTGHLTNVIAIGSGPIATSSLAVTADGSVWDWGSNWYGQLGDGTSRTERYTPFRVPPPTGGFPGAVTAVTATQGDSVALVSNGTIWSWGNNFEGEFGNGTNTDSFTPVQASISGIKAVAAGGGQLVAVDVNNALWSWGWNLVGELGNGTTQNAFSAVRVAGPGGTGFLADVSSIAAGRHHSLAVNTSGAWAWGNNYEGELGNGTTTSSSVPVGVPCSLATGGPTTVSLNWASAPSLSVKGWIYSPNPFEISLFVQNTGQNSTQNLSVTASLPAGLSFASGETATHAIPTVLPNGAYRTSWTVTAAPQTEGAANLTYSATSTANNAPSVTAQATVTLPMVRPRYVAFGDSITTGFNDPTCLHSFDLSGSTGTPWGCPRQAPPGTPYPDLVASHLGYTYSDSAGPYLDTVPLPGFPKLDLARVGIFGSGAQDAHRNYGGYPSGSGIPWLPQLKAVEQAQELVTGGLGINDLNFDQIEFWVNVYNQGGKKKLHDQVASLLTPRKADFDQLFASLDIAHANGAKVVIVLYYNPVYALCGVARTIADVLTGDLNNELQRRATSHNFLVADPRPAFEGPPGPLARGHGLGTSASQKWVFGTTCDLATLALIAKGPSWLPFIPHGQAEAEKAADPHPNTAGAQAIAQTIWTVLGK